MGIPAFAFQCQEREGVPTLVISGELDLETAPAARQLLEEVLERLPQDLVFDFSDLRYLDSSGLGVILMARRRVPGSVVVINSTRTVRHALSLSGMDGLVQVEGDRTEEHGGKSDQPGRQ